MISQRPKPTIKVFLGMLLDLMTALSIAGQAESVKFSVGQQQRFPASQIAWRSIFGSRKEEPKNAYILMTQGSFRAPTSPDIDKLIHEWLGAHPNAEAVLVYTLNGMMSDDPDSKMKSVWLVDGQENLNLYLVRKGACPAGTMVLEPRDETPLSQDEYETFEKKVWEAEKEAQGAKLGIWAKDNEPNNR